MILSDPSDKSNLTFHPSTSLKEILSSRTHPMKKDPKNDNGPKIKYPSSSKITQKKNDRK